MATEYDDSQDWTFFIRGPSKTLTNGNGFATRWSEQAVAALRSVGFLDNMIDGTVPPVDTSMLWLDKNTDPAILKEYNPVGAAWEKVTSQTLFGRVPWRGPWDDEPIYRRGDVVSYNGAIWICILPSQNHPPAEDAYWDLFIPALPDNSVSTQKIIDGAVTTPKLADGAVTDTKLAAGIIISPVDTRAAMKALDTTVRKDAFLREGGREGVFKWTAGDFSAKIAADTAEGIYIKAGAIAASAGAWVRKFDGGADIRWFDGVAGGAVDNAAAFLAASAVAENVYIPDGTFLINVTTGNFDGIFAKLGRAYGPGLIDVYLAPGSYTTAQYSGFRNPAPANINIRGENLSGALTAANVTFAGTAFAYTAAITFPALPTGIAVGQLLSLVSTSLTDKRTTMSLLAGANKITSIVGNVVTVAIAYHGTVTAKMPTIVGSVSFTGAWRLNKSMIVSTSARTPLYVQSPNCRMTITNVGLSGPFVNGGGTLSSGITIGWIDELQHYVRDHVRLSGVGVNGFAVGVLGQGAGSTLLDVRFANCLYGLRGLRQSEFYVTTIYVSNCSDSGLSLEEKSKLFASGEVMSCGNYGRGVWCFTGEMIANDVVSVGYNFSAGVYVKASGTFVAGAGSCAFRNNNIGWGNENGNMHIDGSIAEYNLVSGLETSMGSTSAVGIIARYNENGLYALVGGIIFADACEAYGNSQNGGAAAELSHIRAKSGNFHDNTQAGLSTAGNSHIRADTVLLNGNGTYGIVATLNSSARLSGVSGTGGTSGKSSYDATSTGTTW